MRSRSARERARGRTVVLALVAVTLALPGAAAGQGDAGQGDADPVQGLEVEVGYAGRTGVGTWVPVTVTVQPGRLVAGTLAVQARTAGGGVREERDIEVAVGSRNAYRFVVPRGEIEATLDEGAGDPATVRRPRPHDSGGEFLVGVLGGVPAGAPPVRSEALGTSGVWVDVDPQWVELAAGALEPLSGLVAEGRALATLSEDGLRNLATAVAAGLDLILVEPVADGLDLPWALDGPGWTLPAAQVVDGAQDGPVAATVVAAGRGRVAVTPAALGEGELGASPALWSALVEPRPAAVDTGMEPTVGSVLGAGSSGVPTLPWLAVFLVAYIVVVGPVNGVVLARFGRRELAWVTVPAVTVVFTAGGWLGATGSQPPVGFAGSASAWVDGAASESVVAVARAPTAGRRQVELPGDDWQVRVEGAGEPGIVRRSGSLTVDLELPALQPGGVVARRGVHAPPPLGVEAAATAEGLQVTVTSSASETIDAVEVRAATASRRIGALRSGETRTVIVEGDRLPADQWMGHGDPFGGFGGAVEGPAALEPFLGAALDGNPGLVWVVGTVASSDTGAVVDGRAPRDLGRWLAVGVHAAGAPRVHTVDRALVDGGRDTFRPGPLVVEGSGPVILRYRIPPAGIGLPLRATLDPPDAPPAGPPGGEHGPELSVWERRERQWVPLDDALPDGRGGPEGYVSPLGEVYVRVTGPLFPLSFSGMGLTVEDSP